MQPSSSITESDRRARAWVLLVLLLASVLFGWTYAGPADAGVINASITLDKTVGLGDATCASEDTVAIAAGQTVYYCFTVTNTGSTTLTDHDLVDSELGTILTDFPFTLVPGASAFLTQSAAIDADTTNVATWTASNDQLQISREATDSATVDVVDPVISLAKTVGINDATCAGTDEITVGAGTQVFFCYTVTNTGQLTLTDHDLVDSEIGTILTDFPFTLVPGASAFLTQSAVPAATTTNTATWTASDSDLGVSATASDSATVNVVPPSITLDKTVGTDSSTCATDDEITVAAGTPVVYCYTVDNTGLTTLTTHDLDDTELGAILTDFPFTLAAGASAFITQGATIDTTTTNTATWTAVQTGTGLSASATDSATVNVASPSISLEKTVGTDPSTCATTDEIDVLAGTEVVFCYTVDNTGTATFDVHDLVDSELGDLLTDFPFVLAPGATTTLTATATIDDTTTNTATWMATDTDLAITASASDSATVNVVEPAIELAKTVGTDPAVCATADAIEVPGGTDVVYCYSVTNTGTATFDVHDLVDSELGDLLTDFAFELAPGATTFVTAGATIDTTTTNTATWTSSDPELEAVASASADATVTVTPDPTTTTVATPTTSGAAVASDTAARAADTAGSSSLPVTGTEMGTLAWLGLVLIALGAVALGIGHRRRV